MKNLLYIGILLFYAFPLSAQTFPPSGNFTLPAGKSIVITYEVDVNANSCPEGLVPVMNISNQATVNGSNFSSVMTDDPDIMGANNPTLTPFAGYAIGNLIYNDMNRNGVFDMGDAGISNVALNLYRDVNGNNSLDAGDGAAIGTAMSTVSTGIYQFTVCPGTYIVEVAASNFTMGGALYNAGNPFVSSPIGGALDPDMSMVDNDDNGDPVMSFGVASAAFSVSADRNDIDFGFKTPTTVMIDNVTLDEGTGGSTTAFNFTVTRSNNAEAFNLMANTMDGTATALDLDYSAVSGALVSFTAGGSLTAMVSVLVNHDNKVEAAENFTVNLSGAPAGVIITDASGLGTINNDDNATVTLSGTATQAEGTTFTFTATLNNPVQGGFMVAYNTSNGTATTADNDYSSASGTLNFDGTAGEMETFMVNTTDDSKVELDEDFTASLGAITGAPTGVSVAGMAQTGTIDNNDQALITISDVMMNEGNMGMTAFNFTVTLDKEVDAAVDLNFTTMEGSATLADMDYTTNSGMISPFTANGGTNQMRTITVQVSGDTDFEQDEDFIVQLSAISAGGRDVIFSPAGMTLDGTGTILNDDLPPVIINEVDSDTEGTDMLEFVELFDGGVGNTPLDGLVLVFFNGNDDLSYRSIDLDGLSTDVNGYFLAGNSGVPGVDVTFGNGILQNGADAVALYVGDATTFPNGTGVTLTGLIDAIVYDNGQADDAGLLVLLNAGQPQVNEDVNAQGTCQSMQRFQNGTGGPRNTNTYLAMPPTPKAFNAMPFVSVDVSPAMVSEDGMTDLTYTITRTGQTGCALTVNFSVDGTATSGTDYPAIVGTSVMIPAGMSSVDIVVNPSSDNVVEPDETVRITIESGSGYTVGAPSKATGTIENDDQTTITLSQVGGTSQNEGNMGTTTLTFRATLSNPVQGGFQVAYQTSNGTATPADNDYSTASGTLTFSGTSMETEDFTVNVNGDTKVEADETFDASLGTISMLGVDPADVMISGSPLTSTILNDDQATLTIAGVTMAEGDLGTTDFDFVVTLSAEVQGGFDLPFSVIDGTATDAMDFDVSTLSPLNFMGSAGEMKTITVQVHGEEIVEDHETFTVTLGTLAMLGPDAADIMISGSPATGTINNDDNTTVTLKPIVGLMQNEGNSGTTNFVFTAELTNPVQDGFTVAYTTNDGQATTEDNDYVDNDGPLNFTGTTSEMQTITVVVNGDNKVEANESFTVQLGSVSNTSLAANIVVDNTAPMGLIVNDEIDFGDAPDSYGTTLSSNGARHNTSLIVHLGPTVDGETNGQAGVLADGDDSDPEGDDDDGVTLPSGLVLNTTAEIIVNASINGFLNGWVDFNQNGIFTDVGDLVFNQQAVAAGNNALSFAVPAGATVGTSYARFRFTQGAVAAVPTGLQTTGEVEDYAIQIVNTQFSVNDPTIAEGDAGTTNLDFVISRSNNATDCSVDYAITGGTATTADNDYQALANGTASFTAGGALTQSITVVVNGDVKVESDETVIITISNPVGAGIEDNQGQGTITNDDQTTLAVSNPVLMEGDNGATNAVFDITLTNPTDFNINFDYGTQDGTATLADNDYQITMGAGSLMAGQQSFSVMVPVNGDCSIESDESFTLVLSDLNSGQDVLTPSLTGTATIQNDDATPSITCPGNLVEIAACGMTSKIVVLPIPSTANSCGTVMLEFRYRPVNSSNVPIGPYTSYASSGSNSVSFNLGKYEIEWQLTDDAGSITCSHFLEVKALSVSTPTVMGPSVICPALSGLSYQVAPQFGVVTYNWSYSGTGATIHHNGTNQITIDFAEGATAGTLSVTVVNPCGGANAVGTLSIMLGNILTCAYVNCLVTDLTVTNETLNLPGMPQVFKIGGQINSDATIQVPKTIQFKAGEAIQLNSNFQVNTGAVFIAEIEDCPVVLPLNFGR